MALPLESKLGFHNPIVRNLAGIDARGRVALGKGDAPEIPGFGENLKNRFGVVLRFDPDSLNSYTERLKQPLIDLARKLGHGIMVAERDYPLHVTIMEGIYEGTDSQKRDSLFESVAHDRALAELTAPLIGLKINANAVLIDKGNVLLTATNIPLGVDTVRESLKSFYETHGLKPAIIKNLLHSSVARVTSYPEDVDKTTLLLEYRKDLLTLRRDILSLPLELGVDQVSRMGTYGLLNGKWT